MLGATISTVPCRVALDDSQTLKSALLRMQDDQAAMMHHAQVSLVDTQKWSGVQEDLFDTLFAFQNTLADTADDGSQVRVGLVDSAQFLHYAIEMEVAMKNASLQYNCRFDPTRICPYLASTVAQEFEFTVSQVVHVLGADKQVSDLWQLSSAQLECFSEFTSGPSTTPAYRVLHHAFEEWAEKKPSLRAVEYEDSWLSYGDLNSHACTLAAALSAHGVCVGRRVAVMMDRCLEFPIGTVGDAQGWWLDDSAGRDVP